MLVKVIRSYFSCLITLNRMYISATFHLVYLLFQNIFVKLVTSHVSECNKIFAHPQFTYRVSRNSRSLFINNCHSSQAMWITPVIEWPWNQRLLTLGELFCNFAKYHSKNDISYDKKTLYFNTNVLFFTSFFDIVLWFTHQAIFT